MRIIKRLGHFYVVSLSVVLGLSGFINIIGQGAASALAPGDDSTWTTSPNSLPDNKYDGRSVTYNGYIYEMGGENNSGVSSSVFYAPLSVNGAVGTWQTANALPDPLSGNSAVEANGYIYVFGGYDLSNDTSAVYYAKISSDGSVGSWSTAANPLPTPISEGGAAYDAANGYVYVTDGSAGAGVEYAKLNSDGSVGSWTPATDMPQSDQNGGFNIAGNYLYTLGGFGGTSADTVYAAPIDASGSIGSWTTQTNLLPNGLYFTNSFSLNGYMYAIGSTDPNTAYMYYAPINSDGSVGTWSLVSNAVPFSGYGDAVSLYNGYVYMLGGDNIVGPTSGVYYSQLNFVNQANVANAGTSSIVSITTPSGSNLTCSSASSEANQSAQDSGYTYPLGLVKFCFTTSIVNNQVTLIFVTSLTPSQVIARDYNPTTGKYLTVPGAVITQTTYNGMPALQLTYNITDGGPLDSDNNIDGAITDPVGLAVPVVTTASPKVPDTGYAAPSGSNPLISATIAAAVSTGLVGTALVLRRLNLKKQG